MSWKCKAGVYKRLWLRNKAKVRDLINDMSEHITDYSYYPLPYAYRDNGFTRLTSYTMGPAS